MKSMAAFHLFNHSMYTIHYKQNPRTNRHHIIIIIYTQIRDALDSTDSGGKQGIIILLYVVASDGPEGRYSWTVKFYYNYNMYL